MTRVFIEENLSQGAKHILTGDDAAHISRSLRMRCNERLILCDGNSCDCLCVIVEISKNEVVLLVEEVCENKAELPIKITLFQALPKGDKLDDIVQKATELGACEIVPMITARCVSKPDSDALDKKIKRLQRIAKEAAMQSGRGIIPEVLDCVSFKKALEYASDCDMAYICYEECDDAVIKHVDCKSIAIMIGPEGGFTREEIESAKGQGVKPITLGRRILRTQTAGLSALAVLSYLYESN